MFTGISFDKQFGRHRDHCHFFGRGFLEVEGFLLIPLLSYLWDEGAGSSGSY